MVPPVGDPHRTDLATPPGCMWAVTRFAALLVRSGSGLVDPLWYNASAHLVYAAPHFFSSQATVKQLLVHCDSNLSITTLYSI